MGTTSVFGFHYPEDSAANDVHTDMQTLANDVETVLKLQGALSARPAFGKQGRLYFATDNNQNGGLYRDTGSAWVRVGSSPWADWSTTVGREAGSTSTLIVDGTSGFGRYQFVGAACVIEYARPWTFTGTSDPKGVTLTLPATPKYTEWNCTAEVQGELGKARCQADGLLHIFPGAPNNNGYWAIGGPVYARLFAKYEI